MVVVVVVKIQVAAVVQVGIKHLAVPCPLVFRILLLSGLAAQAVALPQTGQTEAILPLAH